MKVILYLRSRNYMKSLAIDLIPFGINGIEADSAGKTMSVLKEEKEITLLLTDSADIPFLNMVRETSNTIPIFLIAEQTLKPSALREMVGIGITSVISHSAPDEVADEVFKKIISLDIRPKERRSGIRIKPDQDDSVTASIPVKELRYPASGIVLDISTSGIAVQLAEFRASNFLNLGLRYNVNFFIFGNEIKTKSQLVGKRNNAAGFKFNNVETSDMRQIAIYIYSKINIVQHNML